MQCVLQEAGVIGRAEGSVEECFAEFTFAGTEVAFDSCGGRRRGEVGIRDTEEHF
jgi:hypothetical protein